MEGTDRVVFVDKSEDSEPNVEKSVVSVPKVVARLRTTKLKVSVRRK
jgi:hypothetical protein